MPKLKKFFSTDENAKCRALFMSTRNFGRWTTHDEVFAFFALKANSHYEFSVKITFTLKTLNCHYANTSKTYAAY